MEKIAYLILAHNDEKHLKNLVKSLDYKSDFYIHIDKKVDIYKFKDKLKDMKNVHFIDKRECVYWGGFNMINATINLLENCIKSNELYHRIILLSGADYPIKSNEYIHEFFNRNRKKEFIKAFNVTKSGSKHYLKQINNYYFKDLNIKNATLRKVVSKILYIINKLRNKRSYIEYKNNNLDVYFGSQWWAITMECAKYIISDRNKIDTLNKYFRYSFSPDEKYFHTIIYNSPFKENLSQKEIEFKRGTYNYANIHLIHPSLSKIYTIKDIDNILTENKMFVRKVNSFESEELIKKLEFNRSYTKNKIRSEYIE